MSDIPPGRFQRLSALCLIGLAIVMAVACIPYSKTPLQVNLAVIPALGGLICFLNLFTVIVLVGQARPGQRGLAARLAAAYLFSGLLILPAQLAFPGLFAGDPLLGGEGTAAWLWLARYAGFALFVLYFALTAKSARIARSDGLVVLLVAVVAAVVTVLATTKGLSYLPNVTDGSDYHRLRTLGIGPVVVAFNVVALLAVMGRLRVSNTVDLWLAVALAFTCLDLGLRLHGGSRFTGGWYAGQFMGLCSALIIFVAMLCEALRMSAVKTQINLTLERLSLTDALTELPNRRAFEQALGAEWRRAEREGLPISVLMVDIDQFKGYNDSLGHPAGDRCLRLVAWTLRRAARRPYDLTVRLGGEEFALLLPNTEAAGAAKMGEKARAAVAAMRVAHPAASRGIVTISVGVATGYPGTAVSDPDVLVNQADQALYQAKQGGRNAVAVAPAEPVVPDTAEVITLRTGGRAA